MKKIILLHLIIFVFNTVNAQNYIPFNFSNVEWNESRNGRYSCANYKYTVTGDTLINSIKYHKLWIYGKEYKMSVVQSCTPFIDSVINKYVGSVRNDTLNKKVYFVEPDSLQEILLYDFSLLVGDTIPKGVNTQYQYNVIVDIDSLYLGGIYHKIFILDTMCLFPKMYIIEGIGSATGLLSHIDCPFQQTWKLECYKENGKVIYPDSNASCPVITDIPENKETFEENILFPNPTYNVINLNSSITVRNIKVYNIQGILVQEFKKSKTNWELPDKAGVYMVRIENVNGTINFYKIIKSL